MSEGTEQLDLNITVGGATFTGAGPAERVMAALERFSQLVMEHGVAPLPVEPSASDGAASTPAPVDDAAQAVASPPQKDSAASKLSLPEFLNENSIKANPEIAAAIIIWAADHEGKASLTTGEVDGYWRGTKIRPPGNLSRDINKALKEGWLSRDGRKYSATGFGRKTVGVAQ